MTRAEQEDDESWLDREMAGSEFNDVRLRKRFGVLLEQLWKGMGQTIPLACQDWANTKAAYRFMDNDRVSEQDILSGCDVKLHKRLFHLALVSEETGCSVSRTLLAHAISVTSWCEAAGTM